MKYLTFKFAEWFCTKKGIFKVTICRKKHAETHGKSDYDVKPCW